MLDDGELLAQLGADALGRRLRRDEVGKGRLEPLEGLEQAIVLLISDLGLVLQVVPGSGGNCVVGSLDVGS
jgi:hypothetical protein